MKNSTFFLKSLFSFLLLMGICSTQTLTAQDKDLDTILDDVDLDDDNDGIPDIVEGTYNCTNTTDVNTPGFTTNTNLVSGGATGTAILNGLDNGVFNFAASVSGTATWNGGIQIQNQAPVGNFIYAQPQNASNASPTNVATYEYTFSNPVSDFAFFIGGLNNGDQATITAFNGLTPINITTANFSDFSDPVNLVATGNTVVGNNFDNSADPLINTFKVTVFGDVDRIVVTSQKSIADNNNVTIGMYSFSYCTALTGIDFDKDGIPNSLDLDSDNDGILDVYEAGGTDLDGDGMIDGFVDSDNDGLNDAQDNIDNGSGVGEVTNGSPLPLHNTDGTGGVDYLDIDADDDGIVDNIEGQSTIGYNAPLNGDDDNDGIDNQYDIDFAGNNSFTAENTDGEDLEDYRDLDSDNDGDTDVLEAWDTDSNGIPSVTPSNMDSDGDGLDDAFDSDDVEPEPTNGQVPTDFPDAQEPGGDRDWRDFADIDGDGVADNIDLDNDNDGIPDLIEGTIDSDSDGIPDFLDLDSDNDGVTDVKEAGGTDVDGDGRIDNFVDSDDDGLNDAQDNVNGGQSLTEITNGTPLVDPNTDGDALADRIDRDSDNDGIPDVIEAGGTDTNGNGIIDNFTDTDNDGLDDSVDPVGPAVVGTPLPDTNSDSDSIVDRLDVDSDNDGLTDTYEAGGTDANNDGRIDGYVDADNDGFTDTVDTDDSTTPAALDGTGIALPQPNFDGDGRPDYLDCDSDNDGITDTHEAGGTDTNRDGEIDGFTDGNDDGLNDDTLTTPLPKTNTDTNGNPDHLDIDADDDGIVDNIEGQSTSGYNAPLNADADNDGIDNQYDIDFPGNNSFAVVNTDGDALEDYRDLDSDNDTIDDVIEGWDVDADGTPEVTPANNDTENDGLDDNFDNDDASQDPTNGQVPTDFPDAQLPGGDRDWRQSLDIDGDGVNDDVDLDNDNDGIPDLVEGTNDTDGDGIPDYLDLDSDNDGIPDIIEAGGIDTDGDGHIDYPTPGDPMSMNDTNMDGLDDDVAATPLTDPDSDNDGLVDRLDLDSDNDGITDIIEAGGTDVNADGEVDYATPGDPTTMLDLDQDGFIDTIDSDDNTTLGVGDGGTALPDNDTDGDTFPNRLDLDSDNDGIHDVVESGGADTDGNGTADDDDDNVDNILSNGIPTSAGGGNTPTDTGANATPDYLNLDSDEDGCSDANEAYVSANADGGDGGQFGTGTPAATGVFGLVTAATYDTGAVATVTDDTDATACIVLDTDGDGVLDDQEIADNTDPNNPCDYVIANITETQGGDWLIADCDGDGVTNEQEVMDNTNPEDPCDFNADNVTLALSGDYLISDCDGDGVTNGTEISDSTDPENPCDFLETSVTLDRSGDW
ncbi:MAG: beta strand repeat-containing protein, partial [Maribacter sp.]